MDLKRLSRSRDLGMEILIITFQAVVALLGIGVLGFWIIGRHRVSVETLTFLATLSIDIAVPCLALASLIIDFSPQGNPGWWHMPLWWLAFVAVSLLLSLLLSLTVRRENRSEFTMGLFYQNGLFFPLIIAVGLFGNQNPYLVPLFLFIFLHPTLIFSTYPFFYPRGTAGGAQLQRIFNPVLISTLAGMFVVLTGLRRFVPHFVETILTMVGGMASPLFMLILGGNLYNDLVSEAGGDKRVYGWDVAKFVLAKNVVFPLVFLGLLVLLRPDFPLALIVILQAAVPPMTALPIFAERSGGNRAIANQFIIGSFLFSILSIPLVLSLFNRFFPFPH
jgi:predicted permease